MTDSIPATLAEALRWTIQSLNEGKRRSPEGATTAEAEALLDSAFERVGHGRLPRMALYSRAAERLPAAVWPVLRVMVEARAGGRPLQYITGRQAFLGHEYEVTPDVLIPRPETEALVSRAFEELKEPGLGAEIGLGSGIISIELLARFPGLRMLASEASPGALEVAERNAKRILGDASLRLEKFLVTDSSRVVAPVAAELGTRKADFLVSNPPYLVSNDELEEQVLEHEPGLALFSPVQDPVYFYKAIAEEASELLVPDAPVLVEMPHERSDEIRDVFSSQGWNVTIVQDLTGRNRVLVARRKRLEKPWIG